MNLQQAKITLEKINRLYESMTLDSSTNEHEQQLMLSYIKQFYKAFSGEVLEQAVPKKTISTRKTPIQTKKVETVKEVEEIEEIEPIEVPPIVRSTIPPSPKPTEIESPITLRKPIQEERPVSVPISTPPVRQKPTYTPTKTVEVSGTMDDFSELFEYEVAKDISSRLAARPVSDLSKALGINEKILTRNELFNKNVAHFDEAINKLNGYTSFAEARPYLVALANQYGWNEENKKKKAQIFIKLVRRRYN